MIDDIFEWLVIALVVIHALKVRQQCDPGFAVGGVKPSGAYTCNGSTPRCCGEPTGPCWRACPTRERRHGRIYCTGGSKPIVVNYKTVGCTR